MLAWRLDGQPVLVVGGGFVAAGRVALALDAGAEVHLVAPEVTTELASLAAHGRLRWSARTFEPSDLTGPRMVLVAVDQVAVSREIGDAARAAGRLVNVADQPDLCDFWFPASFRDGPIQVAVSTNGASPGAAARLKRLMRSVLPPEAAPVVARLSVLRRALRSSGLGMRDRMDRASRAARERWSRAATRPTSGRVSLVGAGPGDPGLLTVAALDALSSADLVVADRLVPRPILDRVSVPLRVARKWPGRAAAGQEELNRWVLEAVERGQHVVRLKCGDPFVFGRGLDEVRFFEERGVEVTVVAGVSSALAAPLAVGIPPTARGLADRVTVLTGHGAGGARVLLPDFDPGETLIWLMAMGPLEETARMLMRQQGFPTNWPVAVVERATHADQRAVRATLATVADVVAARGLRAPAAIIMGSVVRQAGSEAFEVDLEGAAEVRVA